MLAEIPADDPRVALDEAEYRRHVVQQALQAMQGEFPVLTWKAFREHVMAERDATVEALMTPEGRADPYPLYEAAHELGPVFHAAPDMVLVCGRAPHNSAQRTPFADPGLPKNLAELVGIKQLEKVLEPAPIP